MAKKEFLKQGLGTTKRRVKKMDVIGEEKAASITEEIHTSTEQSKPTKPIPKAKKQEKKAEKFIQTTVYFPRSLHKDMRRKLLDVDLNMKDYLISLVRKDLGKK